VEEKLKPEVVVFLDPPPPFGGVKVSGMQTYNLLAAQQDIRYSKIHFNDPLQKVLSSLRKSVSVFLRAKLVLLQVNGLLSISEWRFVFTIIFSSLFQKKIAFRGFGGGIYNSWIKQPKWKRRLQIFLVNRLDFMTVQTKEDLAHFIALPEIKTKLYWLPNARASFGIVSSTKSVKPNRFCFVGKVWKEKGIDLIIEASHSLPEDIQIDIYGPVSDDDYQLFFANRETESKHCQVSYKGVIDSSEICKVISEYDALLLPTRWITEGHPGVILEAFTVGVPVIASNWNGIPELVDDTCGILIDNTSSLELRNAIYTYYSNADLWSSARKGAKAKAELYSPEKWADELHSWIKEAIYN
jgi:glycosyltransferase involved in cell wall biosynthesis